MKPHSLRTTIAIALFVFIGVPVAFFYFGDTPSRSLLKDSISLVTILAFSLMLEQFFLTRHFKNALAQTRLSKISDIHKYIGYFIVSIFLLHPFLIVLPRYFEAGVEPLDALITIITNFESLGVVLGLIAWVIMLVLGATAIFRYKLVQKLDIKYKAWRIFHGSLSILFILLAAWHAIDLGRHIHFLMASFIIIFSISGALFLTRQYLSILETPKGANL